MQIINSTKKQKNYTWDFKAPKINQGKETIDEMSLIVGSYDNYLVTKTGNLIGHLIATGINLDLLNEVEQEDLFKAFNAFLITTLSGDSEEIQQYLDIPTPVNMTEYIINQKKKYLEEKEKASPIYFKQELIASYIDHWSKVQAKKAMTTKKHILALKVPIKDKSEETLYQAVQDLTEKLNQTRKDLMESLSDFDIQVEIMTVQETEVILKNLINFKGRE